VAQDRKDFVNIIINVGFEVPIDTCFHAGFLLGLFFDPEDIGDMFLRNFG
jgi:hypothetical protein